MRPLLVTLAAASICAVSLPAAAAAGSNGGTAAPVVSIVADGGTVPHSTPPKPAPSHTAPAPTSGTRQPAPVSGRRDIPATYRRLYVAAARAEGVDWRLLAAIGKLESDQGRSTAPGVQSGLNYAHCCAGPMQICTVASCGNPWGHYGVDGDGDGLISVYDPADAIYGAAALVHDLQALLGPHPKLLLAAYNAGAGSVRRYRGVPPYPETMSYVQRGLKYMKSLRR